MMRLQCTRTVEVGGEVDSMLFESGFLFVGLHVSGEKTAILSLPGNIKVYNMTSAAEHTLQGHMVRSVTIRKLCCTAIGKMLLAWYYATGC